MTRTALKSAQDLAAHSSLFCFTLLLLLKLDHAVSYSWWIIFVPVWMFHGVFVRGRFSIPAPSVPHARQWAPCHAVVATPLLIAYELLLCIYLESVNAHGFAAVNLKIVFLPLLAFEMTILIDNFRMCRALMPVDIESSQSTDDEALHQMLPHLWVAISMVFLVIGTVLMLLKLSGDLGAFGWWDLFIIFGIAESFAFLVCTKGSNPIIEINSAAIEAGSSTTTVRYLTWIQDTICSLQNVGSYIMKIPIIGFQVVLCMHLEGTPPGARHIRLPILFSPLFLMQGAAVLIAASRLIDEIARLLWSGAGTGLYSRISSRGHDCLGLFHHGSRLLSWWSIDEGSREEEALLDHDGVAGYKTFFGYPPEIVKKLPKEDLAEEVWRLQAALGEQTQISKHNQQEYEKLHNLKVICRVCRDREINVVLLPCRHHTLCSTCSERCTQCPICRGAIQERLPVYDA